MDKVIAEDILMDFRDIMVDMKIPFWLREGTLLGAVRDGDFIDWDTDMDVSMMATDANRALVEKLASKFTVSFCTYREPFSGIDIRRYGVRMNIMLQFYNSIRDSYITWSPPYSDTMRTEMPAEMYDRGTYEIQFLSESFRVPRDPDTVIRSIYGEDWETPMPDPQMKERPFMKWRKHWTIYYEGMPEYLAAGTQNPLTRQ